MDFGKIATKGQKHIPTTAWNAMREVAQQFENGLPSFESTSANRNPFLVTIENATGASIEPFAVLEISDAMFPNRTGTDFLNEAINRGVELKGIKPSGDEEKNIAITLDGGPNGTLVQAVVVGVVPCKVMVETSSAENYKYAVPVANQTGYLKAAESGNIRILWKESGTGTKWAYVCLDATGTTEKETFLLYSSGSWNASDYIKGNLEYIWYDTAYNAWVPLVTSNPQQSDFAKCRLVVCQEDMPSNVSGSDYYMPYYPLEDNIGVMPNKSTVSGESFVNRCGVLYGEHVLSNKRIDYFFKAGRYVYEPYFIADVFAEAGNSGQSGVYCTINGTQYPVAFPTLDANYNYANLAPDVYAGDMLHVRVELTNKGDVYTITALDYPIDEQDGSVSIAIGSYGGKAGLRGWEELSVLPNPLNAGDLYVLDLGGNYTTINSCPSAQAVGSYSIIKLGIKWYIKRKTNALL